WRCRRRAVGPAGTLPLRRCDPAGWRCRCGCSARADRPPARSPTPSRDPPRVRHRRQLPATTVTRRSVTPSSRHAVEHYRRLSTADGRATPPCALRLPRRRGYFDLMEPTRAAAHRRVLIAAAALFVATAHPAAAVTILATSATVSNPGDRAQICVLLQS